MEISEPFYLHKMRSLLADRQRLNSSYSVRAFARDLGVDSSNLSAVLRKKRSLPKRRIQDIAEKMNLTEVEKALFLASCSKKPGLLASIDVKEYTKKYLIEDAHQKIYSEWEYFAVLQLFNTVGFQSKIQWIAKRLNLTEKRVREVLKNLEELRFVKKDKNGNFSRNIGPLESTENIGSAAIQRYHLESLNLAIKKLKTIPIEKRDFSSICLAIDPKKLPEAQALIREFQDKLYTFLSKSHQTEVYKFNCQLFPISHEENAK